MAKLALLFMMLSVLGCGKNLPTTYGNSRQAGLSGSCIGAEVNGLVPLVDGSLFNLATQTKPLVVFFVSYTCLDCIQETHGLAQYFAGKPNLPTNVELLTVLVGNNLALAKNWQNHNGVTWSMGADADSQLFDELCSPQKLTPCIFTVIPGAKPTVCRNIGSESIDKLQSETGAWLYAQPSPGAGK